MRRWWLVMALAGCSAPSAKNGNHDMRSGFDGGHPVAMDLSQISDSSIPIADMATAQPPAPMAYVTSDDLTQALSPVPVTIGVATADVTITVDASTKYQSIVGFGASI